MPHRAARCGRPHPQPDPHPTDPKPDRSVKRCRMPHLSKIGARPGQIAGKPHDRTGQIVRNCQRAGSHQSTCGKRRHNPSRVQSIAQQISVRSSHSRCHPWPKCKTAWAQAEKQKRFCRIDIPKLEDIPYSRYNKACQESDQPGVPKVIRAQTQAAPNSPSGLQTQIDRQQRKDRSGRQSDRPQRQCWIHCRLFSLSAVSMGFASLASPTANQPKRSFLLCEFS